MSQLFAAQQLQQAYELLRRANQPSFSLGRSQWADVHRWLPLADLMDEFGLAADLTMRLVFEFHQEGEPQPWEVMRLVKSPILRTACQNAAATHDVQGKVLSILEWAMRIFGQLAQGDGLYSRTFISALVESPSAVQPWIRVLLGFHYEEVIRRHLPAALEFFQEHPDIAKACIELGYPPQIINPSLYD
jgi:hypothetical protein